MYLFIYKDQPSFYYFNVTCLLKMKSLDSNVIDYFNAFERCKYLQQQVKAAYVKRAAIQPITAQHTVPIPKDADRGRHCTIYQITLSSHFVYYLKYSKSFTLVEGK